jgi:hypothetical protein
MTNLSAKLVVSALTLSCAFLNAQSMSDRDPTHRPAPLYSKSEKKRLAKTRLVHGIVKDEHDNPVNGALVNLKNLKSKQTETFITKADGKYIFDELSREEDYELSASYSGKMTPVKKLSHFDPQTSSMRILSFGEAESMAASKPTK